ncbi:MAG: TIGR00266 family protein [Oscillospiraceae bacterium]|nr:TIGR00266 family protein [Oscillospiraceae bacterium]
MKYEIFGAPMPAVTVNLAKGESVNTQAGGMCWMTDGLTMKTSTGGFKKGLSRMLTGESLFINTYTAEKDASITFASSVPGDILALDLSGGKQYVAQKTAYLAGDTTVNVEMTTTRVSAGLVGGEGWILQKITGSGTVFLEISGSIKEVELAPGQVLKVDSGNIGAFESSVTYTAEVVKGLKNIAFGGEGLFLARLEGPGKVWLQTMSISELAGSIAPYIAAK